MPNNERRAREAQHLNKTHQSYVAKVEGGERRIDVVEFMELAKVLGVAPTSLLKKLEYADCRTGLRLLSNVSRAMRRRYFGKMFLRP
jgi:transcriptional regulator with XRE-family HTH domain